MVEIATGSATGVEPELPRATMQLVINRGEPPHKVHAFEMSGRTHRQRKQMGTDEGKLYIVTVDVSASVFRERLAAVGGARVVRELRPGRVVVTLRSCADRPRLAALPGVEALVEDRLERPDPSA